MKVTHLLYVLFMQSWLANEVKGKMARPPPPVAASSGKCEIHNRGPSLAKEASK